MADTFAMYNDYIKKMYFRNGGEEKTREVVSKNNWKKGEMIMNRRLIRKMAAVLLTAAMICSFAGCRNDKKDISEDMNQINESGGDKTPLKEKLGITEEHVSYEVGSTGLSVNADIRVPDAGKAGIYEMQSLELTSEYMKSVADKLFDDGEYTIYYPASMYPVDERIALAKEISKAVEAADWNSGILMERWINFYNACYNASGNLITEDVSTKNVQNELNTNEFVFYDYTFEKEDYAEAIPYHTTYLLDIGPGKYSTCTYVYAEGKIEGQNGKIIFYKFINDDSYFYGMETELDYTQSDYYQEDAENAVNNATYGTPGILYTDEELEVLIADYIAKFGFEDFTIGKRMLALCLNSSLPESQQLENSAVGYVYYLTREKNGIQNDCGALIYGGESIRLYITAEGIINGQFFHMYEISEEKENDTTLLEWAQIDEIFQNQVIEDYNNSGKIDKKYKKCNQIEFAYRITNIDEHMMMVPVWIYSAVDDYLNTKEKIMIINAVDGTVIDDLLK